MMNSIVEAKTTKVRGGGKSRRKEEQEEPGGDLEWMAKRAIRGSAGRERETQEGDVRISTSREESGCGL